MSAKKKTQNQFLCEIYQLVGYEYVVLGEYQNTRTHILMRHSVCNYEYKVTPTSFLRGSRCRKCAGTLKKTHEEVVDEVSQLVGDEFIVLGEYRNRATPIMIRHSVCEYEFEIRLDSFIYRGDRCPRCRSNAKKTHDQFLKEVYNLVDDEYMVLEEYQNANTPLLMRHSTCGHEYKVRPAGFVNMGYRCPKCSGKMRKTHEQFVEEVSKVANYEYAVLEEYRNAFTPVLIRHSLCGHQYKVKPLSFIYGGTRCPKCAESKGEKAIHDFLVRSGYLFDREYRIKECRDKNPLPFDFAVFGKNGLICLVEYDGEQHFRIRESWGGESALKAIQKRDKIKTDFCRSRGIPLIRIPYTNFNKIEAILQDNLPAIILEQGAA